MWDTYDAYVYCAYTGILAHGRANEHAALLQVQILECLGVSSLDVQERAKKQLELNSDEQTMAAGTDINVHAKCERATYDLRLALAPLSYTILYYTILY